MRRNHYSRQWLVNKFDYVDDVDVNIKKGAIEQNVTNDYLHFVREKFTNTDTIADKNSQAAFQLMHIEKNRYSLPQSSFSSHPHNNNNSNRRNETSETKRRKRLRCLYLQWPYKFFLNQILEVLLALVLVNCLLYRLTHLPLTLAAYGDLQQVREYHHLAEESLFSNSYHHHSGRPTFYSNDDEKEENTDLRQPHNIGGSAFGYNGLQIQHNLDDNMLRSQNFKISPKPCSTGRIEGTCMFVWECIKSEGRHVGMCVDSFMFGSCCVHNYTDNIVPQNTFSYTRPTKPLGIGSMNHRPRPPQQPHRPSISGMTTIERPHGAGTLVIRPSGPHHQGPLLKPQHSKPSFASTALTSTSASTSAITDDSSLLWTSNSVLADLQSSASISSATTINQQQQHWHLTTEPNFVTKPRPPVWDKPLTLRPKPPKPPTKPSKKPTTALNWLTQQQQQQQLQQQLTQKPPHYTYSTTTSTTTTTQPPKNPAAIFSSTTTSSVTTTTTTTKTKPQFITQSTKPTLKPSPSLTKPYSKPTSTTVNPTTTITTMSTSSLSPSSTTSAYKPTKPATTSAYSQKPQTPSTMATSKPTIATSVGLPTNLPQRPTFSQRPTSTTSIASSSSTSAPPIADKLSHTHTHSNLSSIETNEIGDHLASDGVVIKTISAARSECGTPSLTRPETRIVGGKSAAFGRWPWQVSVRRTSFFGFSSTHRCGGALINENWIATAGHCVDDLLISQIRIRVGEYDFSHVQEQLPYIERGVAKKVVHPLYNFFTYEYDLALVKLEQPLEFAPHVSPICLPETDSLLIGMNATVTGWGRLSEGGTLPSVLQEVSVPIVSNDNCKSMFLRAGRQEFIPEIFLCAGYETGGQDSCQGDSGGPLQVKSQDGRYFLAGIISWGIGCAEANLPGVCTRISKFVPWIIENVT